MKLVNPTIEYKEEIISFRNEIINNKDIDAFAGCSGLEDYENIEDWINHVQLRSQTNTTPNDRVPSDVYLAIVDHRVVGIIDLRHHIDHPILSVWGGHIGYSVRPSERHKGYGKEMLRLNLENARKRHLEKVMITCSSDNAASRRVILANNGTYEKSVEVNGEIIERYWINLTSNQYAKVETIDLNQYDRVLVMSDIHGDLIGFIEVLKEVNYSENDALIIVGDVLEKGKSSLKLLRLIKELNNVYWVLGNNDAIFNEWKNHRVSNQEVLWYMKSREFSILIDMANELHLAYENEEDIQILKEKIFEHYQEEITFLEKLPHILDSELAIFVHAGLDYTKDINHQEIDTCLATPSFSNCKHYFDKPIIVGHWPASNYYREIIDVNTYHNLNNNIISIDGGNSMKSWQQINYLIIENNKISNYSLDRCEQIKCLDAQEESKEYMSLIFPYTEIIVKEKYETNSLCLLPFLNKKIMIKNDQIYEYKYKNYCYDFTTYELKVDENEILSYCEQVEDGILVKRNGLIGKYKGRYEKM